MISAFICLCLLAILGHSAINITNAQLSTLPRRYRRAHSYSSSSSSRNSSDENNIMVMETSHSRVERRQRNDETEITVKRKPRELADEEHSLSMPLLHPATFDLSLSMPSLEESEVGISSMSLFLEEAELSLSLSLPMMFDDSPTESHRDASETVSVERSNTSSTLILSSFIAGLSALVVGATAMFIKMQRVHAREFEQSEPGNLYDV